MAAVPWGPLALFGFAALLLVALLRRSAAPWALALLPLVLLLGVARTQPLPWENPLPDVAVYNDAGPVRLGAEVVEDPDDTGIRLRVTLAARWVEGPEGRREVGGRLLAFDPSLRGDEQASSLRPGDQIVLRGALTLPPIFEEFDYRAYRAYLARQGISSVTFRPEVEVLLDATWSLPRALSPWRHRLARSLEEALPEPEGALARALVVGLRGAMPPPITEAFRATGTSHLLAISGLHVALVMGILLTSAEGVLGRRRHLYLLIPLLGVWGYALLAGMSPSVSRAAVMATLFLVALALGRQSSLLTALALTAAVMAGLDPSLLGSVSFRLSFAAVAGIALLFPWLRDAGRALIERLRPPDSLALFLGWAADAVAVSLAATVATLPLLAFHFQSFSLLSVPLTVALLPALPPILLLSFVTALVGLISPALAEVVGWADWIFLRYVLAMIRTFGDLPGVSIGVEGLSPLLVWGYYGALAAVGWMASGRWLFRRPTPQAQALTGLRGAPRLLILYLGLFLLLASVFLWAPYVRASDGRLHVTVLDVGQGDAILIQSPTGHRVLIDGGPDPRLLLTHLSRRLPLWSRRLDLVVLTHPDEDHLVGLLDVLPEYTVSAVLEPQMPRESSSYAQWREVLEEEGTTVLMARAGMKVTLGPEVEMEFLHPPEPLLAGTGSDSNNNGVVVRLQYRRATFLLPGDIEEIAEEYLVRHTSDLGSAVLKVPHHGSATSTTTSFLETVAPLVAVVSVGEDNPYDHPDSQVIGRLLQQVEHLFLTSLHGSVELVTDGRTLWVHSERRGEEFGILSRSNP